MNKLIRLKIVIIFILLLVGVVGSASTVEQIKAASPALSKQQIRLTAKYIDKTCIKYRLPCQIFTAILIQESMLQVSAINTRTQDYGIGQINIKTIERLKLDQYRLTHDLGYSVDAAGRVLSYMHKRYSLEAQWYCRYNVGTRPMPVVGKACRAYGLKVEQYLVFN